MTFESVITANSFANYCVLIIEDQTHTHAQPSSFLSVGGVGRRALRFSLMTDYLLMELLAYARRGKADLVDAGKSDDLII